MRERSGAKRRKVRGEQTNTQFADGLGDVVRSRDSPLCHPPGGLRT